MAAAVKLYFDSGQSALPADAAKKLEPVIAALKASESARVYIAGFHDATGTVAVNQALAKRRAGAARDALVSAGIAADRIELRKPELTLGGTDHAEARRVELSVK